MAISEVEAIILRQPHIEAIADGTQDALIVRVHTDEGITGIGEVDSSPYVIEAIIEAPRSHLICSGLRELLIGEDPLDVERLWEKMYQGSIFYGRRGAAVQAMSGVDVALWDVRGKALGQPIHKLLGGSYRERVPAYASTLMPGTPGEAAREARRRVEQGFRAVKFGWGPLGEDPQQDTALVRAIREEVGDEVQIMLDVGFARHDAATAIQMARRLEPYRPFWIEEPLPPDDLGGYRRLAEAVEVRVAAGEEESTRYGFRDLLERGGVDVIQPDVTRCGGLSEARKIATLAQVRGVPCVPHSWSTGIVSAASLQLIASISNSLFLELCVQENPLNQELLAEPIQAEDGYVEVPRGPGLGIELDEGVVERYRVS